MTIKDRSLIDAELGTKRVCSQCTTRFYDLNRSQSECPSCGTHYEITIVTPSAGDAAVKAQMRPEPKAAYKIKDEADKDVDDIAVDDIDLGVDEFPAIAADDESLLEDDDDPDDMSLLLQTRAHAGDDGKSDDER